MHINRPSSAPDFLLSRTTGSVRTQGTLGTYHDAWDAVDDLVAGKIDMVVGAIPFDTTAPAALTVPEKIIRDDGPLEPHSHYRFGPGSVLHATTGQVHPDAEEHIRRVQAAVATIRKTPLDKVVLARAIDIAFDPPVDPLLVAARLITLSENLDGFAADLSPAGEQFNGHMLVGSSPEVLIKKQGSTVTAFPLAGSLPRLANRDQDQAQGARLFSSAKDLDEHRFVVESLRKSLQPVCTDLSIPPRPTITRTAEMWHLATPVKATVADPSITALELALKVHPTPAICGTPTHLAKELITTVEVPRNFYAGAVGWSDKHGDGEFMVAIRCAEVSGDGRAARAWAGGGITAGSDPEAELAETTDKLLTILRALGLDKQATGHSGTNWDT
ncbi:isochorismate synthase MenF [Corynebacterium mendelii]|uniref:isochorismate synthase n=1 Tax=Corynebacterium mendelii TaxID=2765362 RepID=A0A939E0D7_9CORY|nr:isochorismate synthase [Corynebacterium mendelii]MBN9644619.1 isochorismate synthase [Corynebacterium mendelii]